MKTGDEAVVVNYDDEGSKASPHNGDRVRIVEGDRINRGLGCYEYEAEILEGPEAGQICLFNANELEAVTQ